MDNWKEKLLNELKLRGYSKKTVNAYLYYVKKYVDSGLSEREFLLKLVNDGKSREYIGVAGYALKFFKKIHGPENQNAIPNIKTGKKLPQILSKKEIEKMVIVTKNFVHRLIIGMIYSTGMRVSEVVSLKWQDIDFYRNVIHLKLAKGRKDRIVMLSPKIKKNLKVLDLIKEGFVFKTVRNADYSIRSIEAIIKNAAKKAGINKKVTPHTLRHSFATHLLENGIDIRYIKNLLGHSRLDTTNIYTKVTNRDISKIKSPIDFW